MASRELPQISKKLSQDRRDPTIQRCRPSRVDDSTPLRAMRTMMPRRRTSTCSTRTSYALPACSFSGRCRGRPRRPRMGMIESSSGNRNWLSWVLAAEISTVSGMPVRSHSTWIFEPGLPRSTRFGLSRRPFFAANGDGLDHRPRPADLPDLAELVQDLLVQAYP